MAWSASAIFSAFLSDQLDGTITFDLDSANLHKIALYDNDITPDKTVTSANTAYDAGQWASAGNEQYDDGTGWAIKGREITNEDISHTGGVVKWDDDGTNVSTAAALQAALTNVTGCLVYNDTATTPVADQGICYLYFGGSTTVNAGGTLTVVFNTSGIFTITV